MGSLILPILAATQTGIKASVLNQDAATVETAIVDAADRINRAPMVCDYTQYAQASVQTRGWDSGQASVTMQHYDPATNAWVTGGCRYASTTDDLVQRVRITITTPNGDVTRSIEVVKSNV